MLDVLVAKINTRRREYRPFPKRFDAPFRRAFEKFATKMQNKEESFAVLSLRFVRSLAADKSVPSV